MDRRRLIAALGAVPVALALGGARKEPKRKDPPEPRASRRRKGAKPPPKHADVAVIGAGALGAWTAWHLVRAGLSVRLFDAYGAGNGRAASNLPTMLYDPAQGGDALYADPATCARAPRLLLHACTLGLHHPVSGQWLQWQLPAPFALPMQA